MAFLILVMVRLYPIMTTYPDLGTLPPGIDGGRPGGVEGEKITLPSLGIYERVEIRSRICTELVIFSLTLPKNGRDPGGIIKPNPLPYAGQFKPSNGPAHPNPTQKTLIYPYTTRVNISSYRDIIVNADKKG